MLRCSSRVLSVISWRASIAWSAAANWLYAPLGMALQARGQEHPVPSLTVAERARAEATIELVARDGYGPIPVRTHGPFYASSLAA